jgi:isoleucyl-tRNA synthetase
MFRHPGTGETVPGPGFARNDEFVGRVRAAFEAEGSDAWFDDGADGRFLGGLVDDVSGWERVTDVLDVWFDSGCTHAFVLGGEMADLYLEGSDQHRGWFQSSLLESCATRGRAPYRKVATHGFVLDGKGGKMSKALGNVVSPADVVGKHSVDLLRLWVVSSDWTGDLKLGDDALKTASEAHRKVRNTLRWLLGNLAHHDGYACPPSEMPELERLLLHRMAEVDREVREGYGALDFRSAWSALLHFVTVDLSTFHFDVRKDVLYCDPKSSQRRRAALNALDLCFGMLCRWLAPMLPFTAEEAWLERFPSEDGSVHLERFAEAPADWRDDALAAKWETVKTVRRVALGALEAERAAGRLKGALEADVALRVSDPRMAAVLVGVDLAEVCLTSAASVSLTAREADGFRLADAEGVSALVTKATGNRCARSWRVLPEVGGSPGHPDLSVRDALAVSEAGLPA